MNIIKVPMRMTYNKWIRSDWQLVTRVGRSGPEGWAMVIAMVDFNLTALFSCLAVAGALTYSYQLGAMGRWVPNANGETP